MDDLYKGKMVSVIQLEAKEDMNLLTLQLHDLHSSIVGAVSYKGHPSCLQLLHMVRVHLVAVSVPLLYVVMDTPSNLTTLIQPP